MTATSTTEPVKMPLPNGPSNLCFNKDEFMKEEFIVDKFVMECRRRVPLETLRDDLVVYMKTLQTAMIELINKDYADFVNLSTNLVGMDKAICNLTDPLEQLKEEIMVVRNSMHEAITAVEEKLKLQARIREKKANLQRLMNIIQSVEKIEKLLGIQANVGSTSEHHSSELGGQLIERVASEFNKLQFYVNKSRGLPLVEQIKPRIANITTTLQYSLEGSFIEGLEKGQVEVLRQCLRTYAIIDKMKDAENLFRQHIVRPYMENVISEDFLQGHPSGLQGMYATILDFIPKHCKKLKEVTSSGLQSSEVIRGYDFLVNAVWPEVIANIEARTPSIFAPGNPDVFHQKYSVSMVFLEQYERQCGSQASVKRLRAHPSYHTFMSKWSLPVYFQIRFQEIANSFESSLSTPFNNAADKTKFHLHGSHTLWLCLRRCWQDGVYLNPLCHRFWKLTLQLLSRYATWVKEVEQNELSNKPVSTSENDQNNKTDSTENNSQEAPPSPPITISQIVCLIVDAEAIASQLAPLYEDVIKRRTSAVGWADHQALIDTLAESRDGITRPLPAFHTYIISEINNQCSVHLRLVNDIPRLFRKTNRDIPSKPSQYVSNLLKPLRMFIEEHKDTLTDAQQTVWVVRVLTHLGEQYYSITSDVLTSVKKMEDSLKRLKRARGSSTNLAAQGMSDDDKIRLQLSLDVQHYGDEIESLGAQKGDVEVYVKLHELVESARNASSTVAESTNNAINGSALTVP